MSVRRINIMGGPGTGKSTLTAWIFAELKMRGCNIEHVFEHVKAWAFIGRQPQSFDQIYIFGKQMHHEDIILRSNPNVTIISESPILLSTCYAKAYNSIGWKHLVALCQEFDRIYPTINFFIKREDCPYNREARFQDYEAALEMDRTIKEILLENNVTFEEIKYKDNHLLLEKCRQTLNLKS